MRAIWIKKNTIGKKEKKAVIRFLLWQCLITLFATLLVWVVWNHIAAKSTLLGGLLAFVPNVFLAWYFFTRNQSNPKKIAMTCYVGEIIKVVSIGILFVLMLRWYDIALAPFLAGFCAVYIVYVIHLCWVERE
ncbi:MAG: hypothetical protein COY58_03335 [Gammaproteobacteria bacterium CG_4_10_14_0_8_um_filter_38_16]|nr:MAG: hypothetical protein COY58_03335 [Gammaproteobacteria bacterium CG_4_10_14_0_8_um_filter_38_16]PJA03957.1 MAG: hypothetical protein COX72_03495 [Gammaproteobacteria bacterium CG_4_10_14_0_2_um_filter_38_22]PJB09716.1 MAG: hypothetical protein CO120_08395 [Gammaproteobacteria bacterium CG_4_9_14_3_um_filter_38_9]